MDASNLSYQTGHIIGGRYQLDAKLGEGGMGAVWRGQHLTLKSPVAIKFINPALAGSEEALQRFMREAQSAAALRSTHIVQVFDFGVDGGVPYIAMELLNGESLGERLEREHVLSPSATGVIMSQVARAMWQAHQAGIVHRDLKPDNIFLVREADAEIVKVLDFGVAKVTGGGLETTTGSGTKTGSILGTPFYVSPEQARGNKLVDYRSDIWALGVITYQCVVGTLPFQSDGLGDLLMQICGDPHPPPSSKARVPLGFDAWMARALDKDPEKRFQSAAEMFEAFQALLSQPGALDLTTSATGAVSAPAGHSLTSQGLALSTTQAPKGRSKLPLVLGTLALLASGAVALGAWWLWGAGAHAEAAASASPPTSIAGAAAASQVPEPEAKPSEAPSAVDVVPVKPEPEPEAPAKVEPPSHAPAAPPRPAPKPRSKGTVASRPASPPPKKPLSTAKGPSGTQAKVQKSEAAKPTGEALFEDRR